jgi:beta-xylosidase
MVSLSRQDRILFVVVALALLVLGVWVRLTALVEVRPVIDRNFPDPDVITVGDDHYAYSTQSRYGNTFVHVPVAHSTDLTGAWAPLGDALPVLPPWAGTDQKGHGDVTAPDVSARTGGGYLLYFVARAAGRGVLCIGAAVADLPRGPFHAGAAPLVCQPSAIDSIDPQVFVDDDGARYLLYASGQVHTSIWMQRMSPDGLVVVGPAVPLIRADRPEEANIVEAPTLVKNRNDYVLFYSANRFDSGRYFINYATAPSLGRQFVKHPGELVNRNSLGGVFSDPGGQNVTSDGRHQDLVFHASTGPGRRSMFVLGLSWTRDGQPVPDLRDGLTHPYS